jgi:hypothetical protein
MSEFTENLSFADPIIQFGLPKLLHTLDALERYAAGSHPILRLDSGRDLAPSLATFKFFNHLLLRRAVKDAHVVLALYEQLRHYDRAELEGKTVITSTITDARRAELAETGVRIVLDCSIQPFKEIVGLNVVEEMVSKIAPARVMDVVEKAATYMPPFVYTKVTGIRSPEGVEAEGWLIVVGGTPEVALPEDVKMKSIGFEDRSVVYACLGETIALTLEGRFENFILGRNLEWEKVHETYKIGLRHGMQLAAISGFNGVYSDEDINRVRVIARLDAFAAGIQKHLKTSERFMPDSSPSKLAPGTVPAPLRLSLLWATLVGLYIYNDYFSIYLPGVIEDMASGTMEPLGPATDTVLVGVALLLAIPALMIYLSAALPATASRWSNIGFGVVYTGVELMTFMGSRAFYQIVVGFEIIVTLLIVWTALRWPRVAPQGGHCSLTLQYSALPTLAPQTSGAVPLRSDRQVEDLDRLVFV